MSFWCLHFLPKNEQKQVTLRYHSSKVEFVPSLFGRIFGLKKSLRLCLTFSWCVWWIDNAMLLSASRYQTFLNTITANQSNLITLSMSLVVFFERNVSEYNSTATMQCTGTQYSSLQIHCSEWHYCAPTTN